MIPVRINFNHTGRTVEQIGGQKQAMHISGFEYALEELRNELLGQEDSFVARFAKDFSSSLPDFKAYNVQTFVKEIIGECEKVLVQHRRYSPENLLDDDLFRTLVQEMLSTKAMARSKFQLYIEEPSRYLAAVKNMPMRDAHMERMASMHRRFEILSGTEESDQEKTRNEALLLCKAEGLVKESINEQNEQQFCGRERIAS